MSSKVLIYEEQIVCEIHEVPREYWPNLLQIIRLCRESIVLKPAEASLRYGWQEAMTGQTRYLFSLVEKQAHLRGVNAVSYTHLTLPTSDLV